MIRLATLLCGALLLTGCSAPASDTPVASTGTGERSASAAPEPVANPTAISIPAIDAHSTLIPLGLTDDCPSGPAPCLASPPLDQPGQAGWYAGRDPEFSGDEYQPGENGPAVIAGHVDGYGPDGRKGHPGVFYRLGELAPGNEIVVERDGQEPLTFVVTGTRRAAKEAFPTEEVYGATRGPELRLITCGGAFDRSSGHYVDNIIVFAELAA